MFQQARERVDSYQIREKVYEKYINGRLDHVDKMEEFMFERMQLMERKSFALACDTVAKGVVQEATEWINRKKKRKLKQEEAQSHATEFAWQQVNMCKTTDPGMTNASLAMSIASHVAHNPDKKPFSDCDWELPKQQFRGWLSLIRGIVRGL
jgi:hypothetical protein